MADTSQMVVNIPEPVVKDMIELGSKIGISPKEPEKFLYKAFRLLKLAVKSDKITLDKGNQTYRVNLKNL